MGFEGQTVTRAQATSSESIRCSMHADRMRHRNRNTPRSIDHDLMLLGRNKDPRPLEERASDCRTQVEVGKYPVQTYPH
mgnify:CR=1 FL=1